MQKNKITTYLLYAVGEVILVMIGIIGAFQIEEWKDEREKKKAANTYLRQIQEEILGDMVEFNEVKTFSYARDSLIDLVLRSQFTEEDYRQNLGLITLLTIYNVVQVDRSGYDNLVKNIEQVPQDYQEIFTMLKKTYENVDEFENISESISNNVMNNFNDIGERFPYFYLFFIHPDSLLAHPSSGELLDYLANDPVFKMKVASYGTFLAVNLDVTATYKLKAALTYKAIDQLLKSDAPSKIEQYLMNQDSSNYAHIMGNYASNADTITIKWENDHLSMVRHPSSPTILYHWHDSSYTTKGYDLWYVKEDSLRLKLLARPDEIYLKLNNR